MEKSNYQNYSSSSTQESLRDEIDLRDIWRGIYRKKKWFLLTTGIIFLGTLVYTVNARVFNPIFNGSFTLLINDPLNPKDSKKSLDTSLFSGIAEDSSEYEINTLITFLKSPIFLEPISKQFNIPIYSLKNNISINQVSSESGRSSKGILNVFLNFNNRKTGKKILTKLSEDFLKASLDQKQKRLNDGLNFLNAQAPEIQKRKDALQSQIVKFREENKMILPTNESGSLKDQQLDLETQIRKLNTERNKLKDIRNEIEKGTLTARGLSQELGNGLSISDFDQGLLQELINVENEIAQAKSQYTSNSSVVKGLNQRLERIQPLLLKNQLEAVDTALKLNLSNLETIKEIKKDIENKFSEQPLLIKKFENLDQELAIANENLLSLISARESFQLEMAQNNIPWRIISKPSMGGTPIKPNIKLNLFFGLIGGIFAGAAVAIIRDKRDHFFYNPEEVKEETKSTILGHIPHVDVFEDLRKAKSSILELIDIQENDKKSTSKTDTYQRFFFQEAFRNLYTSIRFINTNNEVKTLLLTSSLPKEGKTLVNILLAKTLADLGVKVLLIDADMRKPQLHFRLGINNLKGLSNLLIDNKITIESVKINIKNYKNWDVITGGTLPPDPTRLLGSKRFKNIIDEIKASGKYELILLDSPPILGLADSLLISEHADGVIVLVGLGAVDRSLPKATVQRIKSIGSNFYGIVTNQTRKDKYNLRNYGYSNYGDGYNRYQTYGYSKPYNPIATYKNYSNIEDINKDISQSSFIDEKENKYINLISFFKKKIDNLLNWLEK